MAKNYNPADAFRKAQRAKELKKNKETRKKVRDVQTVKRDTRELEAELRSLKGNASNASKSRIAELEQELAYVLKAKEAYVKENPDEKDKVFKPRGAGGGGGGGRRQDDGEGEEDENGASGSGTGTGMRGRERLYDENGRLRDPTRSAYYDPVYNPWGVPPPGMAYKERPGLPGVKAEGDEDESDEDEDEDESDEEIVMPEGPPPAEDPFNPDSDSDADSDDIPLPAGPPPPRAAPPIPSGPSGWGGRAAPVPVPFHQPIHMGGPGLPMGMPPPIPYPQFQQQPLQPFPGQGASGPSNPSNARFRPPRQQARVVQDPLSDEPTQTYQGYHASLPDKPPASLPGAPPHGAIISAPAGLPARPPPSTAPAPPVEISAAPVLRDLRKEATVFVPRNLKRKAPAGSAGGGSAVRARINAAPGGGMIDDEGDEVVVRPVESGLMGKLKGVLGDPVPKAGGGGKTAGKSSADEDYERFLAGLGDIS